MGSSFAEKHPELLTEWSDRNSVSPEDISYGSNTVFWWKGACGHEWQTSVKSRSAGEGCPVCANKRVVPGINDLASQYPDLMREWSEENELDPAAVSPASHKKAKWIGKCGHRWETEIRYRTLHGTGCPYCSGNRLLRGFNDLQTKFPGIAFEWSNKNKDLTPDMVLAFSSRYVWWKCRKCGHEWRSRIADRTRGHGCPCCTGATVSTGISDLGTLFPEIAKDWSEKNGDLTPERVSPKSRRNVWWKCSKCGYEWQGVIYARVHGQECPACDNRAVMPGHNDLATTDPEILREWDYDGNTVDPHNVSRLSQKVVKWKCGNCHQYRMKISDRTLDKKECPYCRQEFLASLPGLAVLYYTRMVDLSCAIRSDEVIGLPLEAYVPVINIAFEVVPGKTKGTERSLQLKRYLCNKKGIKLIELHVGENPEPVCILRTVKKEFKKANVFLTSDENKDLIKIRNTYNRLKENARYGKDA